MNLIYLMFVNVWKIITKRGLEKHLVKYYGLISAQTGYGIEKLISKVFRYWSQHGLPLFRLISILI